MASTKPKVIRKEDARNFMEGDEYCREYVRTEKIVFGTSTLQPGQRGAVDPGHPKSHEVFFVVKGHVLCHIPEEYGYFELGEGDVIMIPEGLPHILVNVGDDTAVLSWSCAPSP